MGAKIRSRLPEGHGLTADLADELADDPTREIFAIVRLGVDDIVIHPKTEGSKTTVLEMLAIEPFDDAEGEGLLRQMLSRRIEDRTGERAIFDTDGAPTNDAIPGHMTGDPAEYARQIDLLRKERAAELQEKADKLEPNERERRMDLEAEAEAFTSGARDDELRAELAPAFSDGAQPQLVTA